jgi:hypothetical protein
VLRSLMRSEQGDVYEKIIQEVVDASKNDFEESGVGQATLNELQQVSDDRPSFLLLLPGDMRALLYARMKDNRLGRGSEEYNRESLLSAVVRSHLADRWLAAAAEQSPQQP